MNDDNPAAYYYVWGADRIVYGPVELPTVINWIRDDRVLTDTWVFVDESNSWVKAGEQAELRPLFAKRSGMAPRIVAGEGARRITPGALRRVKILADLEDRALESILRYMQPEEVGPFATVVRQGEPADAMYFIIEGEMRAYVVLDGKESTLATFSPGETFGEIALLDKGDRSANVASNQPSLLLRLPATNFEQILREAPALAAPFALGLARMMAARLRALGKRYQDSIRFSRSAGAGPSAGQ
jgi:CRP-like cAMP-binding protein